MIRITASKENGKIRELEVKGHAGSGTYGHDLVCAIVSGIVTGLCNALDQLSNENDMELKEGYAKIVIHDLNEKTDTIMNTGLIMLATAEEVNKDFVSIRVMEV